MELALDQQRHTMEKELEKTLKVAAGGDEVVSVINI
jgi:hypothetical protein